LGSSLAVESEIDLLHKNRERSTLGRPHFLLSICVYTLMLELDCFAIDEFMIQSALFSSGTQPRKN
jgi:hypothetical protein